MRKALNTCLLDTAERYGILTVDVCPACGYPTIGPDLCAFCRPVEMLIGDKTFGRPDETATMWRGGAGGGPPLMSVPTAI